MPALDLDTILVALHERRNRLLQLDMEGHVYKESVPKLRTRINECNAAIRAVKSLQSQAKESA